MSPIPQSPRTPENAVDKAKWEKDPTALCRSRNEAVGCSGKPLVAYLTKTRKLRVK